MKSMEGYGNIFRGYNILNQIKLVKSADLLALILSYLEDFGDIRDILTFDPLVSILATARPSFAVKMGELHGKCSSALGSGAQCG